ncbi:MAG: SH3 domain-containing protein [Rhodospirillales bacterium]|nr:MAG: SH3 domain-containing protein [Rhodospirillales bacterium]
MALKRRAAAAFLAIGLAAAGASGGDAGAQGPAGGFPFEARSWGGIVRAAPGMGSAAIATLAEREPITVLEVSNAPDHNGSPWFKIRFRGRTGYHWGGIICPIGAKVAGTFEVCD